MIKLGEIQSSSIMQGSKVDSSKVDDESNDGMVVFVFVFRLRLACYRCG
jgi:hypothetical protein